MKLRTLCENDASGMLEWMHDSAVNQYFRAPFAQMTIENALSFIQGGQDASARHYAICDDKDVYQGTISLKAVDMENGTAEYAIVLRRQAQGKGYASFATREILRIAFEELGLHKVYLNVWKENAHAVGFYEHMGFRREGDAREQIVLHKRRCDLLWYGMLRREYRSLYGNV